MPLSELGAILVGTLAATVMGYLTLRWLVYIVGRGRVHFFAPYCFIIGVLALFVS